MDALDDLDDDDEYAPPPTTKSSPKKTPSLACIQSLEKRLKLGAVKNVETIET